MINLQIKEYTFKLNCFNTIFVMVFEQKTRSKNHQPVSLFL